MDDRLVAAFAIMEASGYIAPVLFILFHVLRQFLFIPVALVCMAGGILFGSILGTIYSLIGLTLLSIIFYFAIKSFTSFYERLLRLKEKWFGKSADLTTGQIAVLRLIPFIHYQLLNLCLMQKNPQFKPFVRATIISNIPLAFFYTVFGQYIKQFSPPIMVMIIMALAVLFYLLREKVRVMSWNEFFPERNRM
ncbi:TVP38/TMEM64 family protein [Rossellomorea oryzaecorticis]|uniref:TVP38/TMEM64 family membrane protein n=1 Tax=Rossellomorea oryzaecorticis TaxID=1396505 RepID=A0ABW8VSN8_9BACI|nr:VTT domain-containing protein [[Bacillus] enclensis]MBH9967015.1 TVP38/TMEM64 family protein [[Bacillus] enclensis]OAT84474.1 alkaline phosphatase [Bacillus sp. MKU004]